MTVALRLGVLTGCLVAGNLGVRVASRTEATPLPSAIARLPTAIGEWQGADLPPLEPRVLQKLGVDEYVNRVYRADRGGVVVLYVGYYASQRQGDTVHSPLNCLPGAGWSPVARTGLTISLDAPGAAGRAVTVNRYVVEKGLDRQVVLYWYQAHGRTVADEYRSKLFLIYDALRLNRTDVALVRVSTQLDRAADQSGAARAVAFVKALFPVLEKHLPS